MRRARIALACAVVLGGCAQGGGGETPRRGDMDGGRSDGGTETRDSREDEDAGGLVERPDTGPGAECSSSGDCSDGVACNGVERCAGGECTGGDPITCDDGIGCTTDACDEGTGSCTHRRDDTLCPSGESCTASTASGCASGCSESPCRLVAPQCGCGPGLGCYISGSSRVCVTAGTASEGASCTSLASCAPGLICVDVGAGASSVLKCSRLCTADSDCVGPGSLCMYDIDDGTGGTVSGARLCSQACDAVAQTGCVAGAACGLFVETAATMRYLTDCWAPVGSGAQGTACTDDTGCRAGFACVDPDGSTGTMRTQCLHWCNAATGAGCPTGTTCRYGFSPAAVVGAIEYGLCG